MPSLDSWPQRSHAREVPTAENVAARVCSPPPAHRNLLSLKHFHAEESVTGHLHLFAKRSATDFILKSHDSMKRLCVQCHKVAAQLFVDLKLLPSVLSLRLHVSRFDDPVMAMDSHT